MNDVVLAVIYKVIEALSKVERRVKHDFNAVWQMAGNSLFVYNGHRGGLGGGRCRSIVSANV